MKRRLIIFTIIIGILAYSGNCFAWEKPEDQPQAITRIELRSINTDLKAGEPVLFTTELGGESAEQMEIVEEAWTEYDQADDREDIYGVWNEYVQAYDPVTGELGESLPIGQQESPELPIQIRSNDEDAPCPETGKTYAYSILLQAKEGYVFAKSDICYETDFNPGKEFVLKYLSGSDQFILIQPCDYNPGIPIVTVGGETPVEEAEEEIDDPSPEMSTAEAETTGFKDVPSTHVFYKSVTWALDNGITKGYTGTDLFGVADPCTRGQAMTFLWRLAGKPEPGSNICPFPDVPANSPHRKAIIWASENKIANGYTTGSKKGQFGINDTCTRGQIVTFLWRFRGQPEAAREEQKFPDVTKDSPFYRAIQWAGWLRITKGLNGTDLFGINKPCTRGQIVTFLYRINDVK